MSKSPVEAMKVAKGGTGKAAVGAAVDALMNIKQQITAIDPAHPLAVVDKKAAKKKAAAEKTAPQIQLPKSYKSRQPNPIDEIQGSDLFHTSGGPALGRAPVAGALEDQKEATAPQVLTGKGMFAQ